MEKWSTLDAITLTANSVTTIKIKQKI